MYRYPVFIAVAMSLSLLSSGCDKQRVAAAKTKVTGKVTLDGKPVLTGRVVFDLNNGEPPTSFDILDGQYEGLAMVGKNHVSINATKKVNLKEKMKMDGPGYDQLVEENMIPARYNTASEITREVVAGQPNEFNFELKSK